eukprot:TRINITY_DN54_c0_g1_i1.p1 TRINITY_DN54_c0_g1~~TRINITY_DN54_c0_g1_i1.p1  ORF type:complete len:105 (+),score=19.43 TRINITY_DN54_c0_g1_i1:1316-1630(+)
MVEESAKKKKSKMRASFVCGAIFILLLFSSSTMDETDLLGWREFAARTRQPPPSKSRRSAGDGAWNRVRESWPAAAGLSRSSLLIACREWASTWSVVLLADSIF